MNAKITCPVCKGTGKELFKHVDHKTGEYIEEKIICEFCGGSGQYFVEPLHSHFGFVPTDGICEMNFLDSKY